MKVDIYNEEDILRWTDEVEIINNNEVYLYRLQEAAVDQLTEEKEKDESNV